MNCYLIQRYQTYFWTWIWGYNITLQVHEKPENIDDNLSLVNIYLAFLLFVVRFKI